MAGLSREIGDTIVVASDRQYGPEQLFLKVASGEVKYAVVNESIARALARSYRGKVDVGTAISFTQFQCWVLRTGNRSLQAFFNSWLRRLKASGDYDRSRQHEHDNASRAHAAQRVIFVEKKDYVYCCSGYCSGCLPGTWSPPAARRLSRLCWMKASSSIA